MLSKFSRSHDIWLFLVWHLEKTVLGHLVVVYVNKVLMMLILPIVEPNGYWVAWQTTLIHQVVHLQLRAGNAELVYSTPSQFLITRV